MTEGEIKRRATAQWLHAQGIRSPTDVSPEDFAELRSLLAPHKGFGIFWSLLMFDRQNAALRLTNSNLSSPAGLSEAAQLQGMIKAIDSFHALVLDIADPIGESSNSPEPRAGAFVNG